MRHNDETGAVLRQYRSPDGLRARQSLHERFTVADTPFFPWVFARLGIRANARILECGCGNGMLWRENLSRLPGGIQVTLTDLSEGMLGAAIEGLPEGFTARQADVVALPFADGTFDAVIANHMLYHVPDIGRAIAEIRRVLAPDGFFVCTTLGEDNLSELWDLCAGVDGAFERPAISFTLENGAAYLRRYFARVDMETYPAKLYVTDARALRDYIASSISFELLRESALGVLTERLEAKIQKEGGIPIRKTAGLFRCQGTV